MAKSRILWITLLAVLLSACQSTAQTPAAQPTWTVVPLPVQKTAASVAAATPSPTLTAAPNGMVETDGETSADAAVSAAARSYFQALEKGDFQAAANLYSTFSLMIAGVTRDEAALKLQAEMVNGSRWSSLEVKETRPLDDHTILVHVTYKYEKNDSPTSNATPVATEKAPVTQIDALWPLRLENSHWLYNRDNVIDYRILDVPEQAMGGLIVKPRQLTRFSDHIRLTLMVQNITNEAIVLGQVNEIMAMFTFKDQQIEAVKKQIIFDRLSTNPLATIDVMGLYESYPTGVIIRQWKNYNVKPWFTFQFAE